MHDAEGRQHDTTWQSTSKLAHYHICIYAHIYMVGDIFMIERNVYMNISNRNM